MNHTTRRVYPAYVPPPIEVVVHNSPQEVRLFHSKVTHLAENKFAQAVCDFVEDISYSLVGLPTTVHDIQAQDIPIQGKPNQVKHDKLSLAEMGLSGYKYQGKQKTASTKIVPSSSFLSIV